MLQVAAGVMDQHGALRGVIASRSTAGTFQLGDAAPKGTGHHSDGGAAAAGWPPLSSPLCSTASPGPPPLAELFVFFRWLCLPSSPGQEMSRAGSVKPGCVVVWAVSVCPCTPRCALSQLLDCTGQNTPPAAVDSIRTAVHASWRQKIPNAVSIHSAWMRQELPGALPHIGVWGGCAQCWKGLWLREQPGFTLRSNVEAQVFITLNIRQAVLLPRANLELVSSSVDF